MYLSRSIRGTLPDASEEVFVFPLSPMSGKERKLRGRHSLTFFSRDDGLNKGGEMEDVRLFNRALSEKEIQELYKPEAQNQ
jgi:hypothetical protein